MLQLCLGGLQLCLSVSHQGFQRIVLNPEGLQQSEEEEEECRNPRPANKIDQLCQHENNVTCSENYRRLTHSPELLEGPAELSTLRAVVAAFVCMAHTCCDLCIDDAMFV